MVLPRRRSQTKPATQASDDRDQHDRPERADVPLHALVVRAEEHARAEQGRVPDERARGRRADERRERHLGQAGRHGHERADARDEPAEEHDRHGAAVEPAVGAVEVLPGDAQQRVQAEDQRAAAEAGDRVEDQRAEDGAERRREQRGHEAQRALRDLEAGEGQDDLRRDRREHGLHRHHDGEPRVPGLHDGVLDGPGEVGEHAREPMVAALHEESMRDASRMTRASSVRTTAAAARRMRVRPRGHPRIVTAADDG